MNNQGSIAFVDSSLIVREMLDRVLSIEKKLANFDRVEEYKITRF